MSLWLDGQVSLLRVLTDFKGNFVLIFVPRACVIFMMYKKCFSLGTAAHMSVGYMDIIRGCFSFPYVDGGRISGWQEQAGKAGGVLAPLLADTVSAFCRALTKMKMATDTEHRFWGENINSCGRQ